MYVTCPANVFVERRGEGAQNKPQLLVIALLLENKVSERRCPLAVLAHGAARATRPRGINTLLFQGHGREVHLKHSLFFFLLFFFPPFPH